MPHAKPSHPVTAHLASVSIALGVVACAGGLVAASGLILWPNGTDALLAALSTPLIGGLLCAALVASGLNLVLRGLHIRATLSVLSGPAPAPPAAVSPAVEARPAAAARWEPRRVDPGARDQPPVEIHLAKPRVVVTQPSMAQVGDDGLRDTAGEQTGAATVPTEAKPSSQGPITGKPFRPHPIFMARPPK